MNRAALLLAVAGCALPAAAQSPSPVSSPAAAASPAASATPAPPPYTPAPADPKRGRELFEQALAAHGGAAAFDAVERVEFRGTSGRTLPGQAPMEMASVTQLVIPDLYRHQLTTQAGPISTLLNKDGAFVVLPSGGLPLPPAEAAALRSTTRRNLFMMVRGRKAADFKVARVGSGRAGDAALEMIEIEHAGDRTVLGIDPQTGLVRQMIYPMPMGQKTAMVVATLSDYRALDNGVKYPFSSVGTVEGQPAFSTKLESVAVNPAIDAKVFVQPSAPADMPAFETPASPGPAAAPSPVATPSPVASPSPRS